MRRLAVTTFAVLYGIMVLAISAQRFNDWAAEEATGLRQLVSGQLSPVSIKADKAEAYSRYKRIVERPFVIESPRERVGVSTVSTRHTPLTCFEYQTNWNDSPVSSRPPPFQI